MPQLPPRSDLIASIRARFAHVEECPFTGPRIFFENAGGALTLRSVAETAGRFAAYPDNQGRSNAASAALMDVIAKGKSDARTFFNAQGGQVFVGESGTEVLFRLIRTAALTMPQGGRMIGSTLEHPASRSAMRRWADVTGRQLDLARHDDASGSVTVADYAPLLGPDLRVASIIHTSPVTGIAVDVAAVAAAIRDVAPDCLIIVDGIQHASHGHVDLAALGVDGYAISPYKVFSRHGYGIGWASDRLSAAVKETVIGGSPESWEQGTRDAGAYATWSDVVAYFRWLGQQATLDDDPRAQIEAGAQVIGALENDLTRAIMQGVGNRRGLAHIPGVRVIAGLENPAREGVVSLTLDGVATDALVDHLNARGIRTHSRRNDHYSGNVLEPLGLGSCVRVSYSHYNTEAEIACFLAAMEDAAEGAITGQGTPDSAHS